MRIGIDGNEANQIWRVGSGQYAFHILTELSKIESPHEYFVYLKSAPLPDMPKESKKWHYRVFGPSKLWTKIALPFHLYTDGVKLDVFYSPGHYTPAFCPFPLIPTIHDLGYLDARDQFTAKDLHQLIHWTKHSIQKSFKIAAVSEFTKSELHRIYHVPANKISIVYNGISKIVQPTPETSKHVLDKFKIKNPYFLYLGTLKPNKNLIFLIQAFAQFITDSNSNIQLVIAVKKGWLFKQIFDTFTKSHLENQVIFTDYISETEKNALYSNAIVTVLPSLYEGFGIPAIESQQLGTPVIASDIPAFREVLENSAIYIDPNQLDTLVAAFKKIQNKDLADKLVAQGLIQSSKFTWENSAKSLLDLFSSL